MSDLGRVTAYLSRLEWRGLLTGLRPSRVERSGSATLVHLRFELPDTDAPGSTWQTLIVVRLRDGETEDQWTRRMLDGLADAIGHELGEALHVDGRPAASPHTQPRVWPWRPTDRQEQ